MCVYYTYENISVNFNDDTFIGSHTGKTPFDYFAKFSYPNFATIPANHTRFLLNIRIFNDRILEDDETVIIEAIPPSVPDGYERCMTELTIQDDDGKLLISKHKK